MVGILATDGLSFVSPTYAEQAAHAHGAGLRVWHYHFCRPESDPQAHGEMAHFWRTVRPHYQPGDRLVLDVERNAPGGIADLITYVRACDSRLHRISGIAECCYMPDSLFRACGPALQIISGEFWIASWGGKVARLGHGRKMVAQQISDGHEGEQPYRMPGIGACDVNRLQRWYLRRLRRNRRRGW